MMLRKGENRGNNWLRNPLPKNHTIHGLLAASLKTEFGFVTSCFQLNSALTKSKRTVSNRTLTRYYTEERHEAPFPKISFILVEIYILKELVIN